MSQENVSMRSYNSRTVNQKRKDVNEILKYGGVMQSELQHATALFSNESFFAVYTQSYTGNYKIKLTDKH